VIRSAVWRALGGDMIVFAHAADWLEPALFALPAAAVVLSIVRSLRARRRPATPRHEEVTR
jgi:hypothetical protein